MRASRNKAFRIEEIYLEAVQITPNLTRKLVFSIWKRCGELRYLIKPWATAEMIPIYKQGNPRSLAALDQLHYYRSTKSD